MKKYRIFLFCCEHCGIGVKILIRKDFSLQFNILDKNYSEKDVLNDSGYYVCVICNERNEKKFEYLYT